MTLAGHHLIELLERLDGHLRAGGARISDHWQPGAARAEVEAALAGFGLRPPEDLIAWFGWHDGTDADRGAAPFTQCPENLLLGVWYSLTLDGAVALRRQTWALYTETGWDIVTQQAAAWFPVLVWEATPLLCVDCSGDPAKPAPVHILDPWAGGVSEGPPHYPSLGSFIAEAVDLFETGRTRPGEEPGTIDVRRDDPAVPGYW